MPDPSSVSSQNVNSELGVSTTATIDSNNNWVRNVATQSTGAVEYGRLRWGINFPGRFQVGSIPSEIVYYNVNDWAEMYGYQFSTCTEDPPFSSCSAPFCGVAAVASISLFSNGVLQYKATGTTDFYRTWLTSGVNSDYTVRWTTISGTPTSGDLVNTDLALSTTRQFVVTVSINGVGANSYTASGNLIIKSGGTTLFHRPVYLTADASTECI